MSTGIAAPTMKFSSLMLFGLIVVVHVPGVPGDGVNVVALV
jgi:hypothetical protein